MAGSRSNKAGSGGEPGRSRRAPGGRQPANGVLVAEPGQRMARRDVLPRQQGEYRSPVLPGAGRPSRTHAAQRSDRRDRCHRAGAPDAEIPTGTPPPGGQLADASCRWRTADPDLRAALDCLNSL